MSDNKSCYLRAFEAYKANRESEAYNILRDVVEEDPNHAEAWYLIGVICVEWGAFADEGSYDNDKASIALFEAISEAIFALNKTISINPSNVDAYYHRGNAHCALENYQSAIEDYTQAISIDPNHVEAYYYRANAHFALKNYQSAIEDYTQTISIYSQKWESGGYAFLINRANAYRAMAALGGVEKAIAEFRSLICALAISYPSNMKGSSAY